MKKIKPIAIVHKTSSELMTPEVIANPRFAVTNPKVIKTAGPNIKRRMRYIENLFSSRAQRAAMESDNDASATAPIIKKKLIYAFIQEV